MGQFFGERERTAESIFAHDEQLRFLAHRRGMEAISVWAAESMGLSPEERMAYTRKVVDAYVEGMPEDRLVASVQTDLERAGKPALSTHVGTVLAQAIADAEMSLRGQAIKLPEKAAPVQTTPHSFNWTWGR